MSRFIENHAFNKMSHINRFIIIEFILSRKCNSIEQCKIPYDLAMVRQ